MFILKVLDFINVLDSSGKRLSLTNIALIGMCARFVFAPNADYASIATVIVAFANYAHKRSNNTSSEVADEEKRLHSEGTPQA